MEIQGIRIPEALKPLSQWTMEHEGERPPAQLIRVFNGSYLFVIDKADEAYARFVEKCAKDSRSLRQALAERITLSGLPFSFSKGPLKCGQRRRLTFLIRPPFFSGSPKMAKNRSIPASNETLVILHFDDEHNFHRARTFLDKPYRASSGIENWSYFNRRLAEELNKLGQFFKENYGNWPVYAEKITEVVELIYEEAAPREDAEIADFH